MGRGSPEGDPSSSSDPPSPPSVVCAEMLFRCNYVAYVAEFNRDVCRISAHFTSLSILLDQTNLEDEMYHNMSIDMCPGM